MIEHCYMAQLTPLVGKQGLEDLQKRLDEKTRDGWELCASIPVEHGLIIFHFRRVSNGISSSEWAESVRFGVRAPMTGTSEPYVSTGRIEDAFDREARESFHKAVKEVPGGSAQDFDRERFIVEYARMLRESARKRVLHLFHSRWGSDKESAEYKKEEWRELAVLLAKLGVRV